MTARVITGTVSSMTINGIACKAWTEEEEMVDKWVDIKTWDEFEEGMRIRDGNFEYTIDKIGVWSYGPAIFTKCGNYEQKCKFRPGQYQRLETAAPEEEAPAGSWEPVEYDDIKIGNTIRYEDDRRNSNAGGKFTIGKFALNGHGKMRAWATSGGWLQKTTTYLRWQEASKSTDKFEILEKVFAKPKQRYTPKKISDHPHKCWNCNSPSYNSDNTVYCSNPYCRFGKKKS